MTRCRLKRSDGILFEGGPGERLYNPEYLTTASV